MRTSSVLFAIVLLGGLFASAPATSDVVYTCECNADCDQMNPDAVCVSSGSTYGRCCPGSSNCPADPGNGTPCGSADEADTADTSSSDTTGTVWVTEGETQGGCGCSAPADGSPPFGTGLLLAAGGLVLAPLRRGSG